MQLRITQLQDAYSLQGFKGFELERMYFINTRALQCKMKAFNLYSSCLYSWDLIDLWGMLLHVGKQFILFLLCFCIKFCYFWTSLLCCGWLVSEILFTGFKLHNSLLTSWYEFFCRIIYDYSSDDHVHRCSLHPHFLYTFWMQAIFLLCMLHVLLKVWALVYVI
jgi:hypothetical protein